VSEGPAAAPPNVRRRWSYGRSLLAYVGDGPATGASPTVALRPPERGLERDSVRGPTDGHYNSEERGRRGAVTRLAAL
jgi:hypothetical protein